MKEKLAATVVLYIKDKQKLSELVQNILSYSSFVRKVYIVDNSSFDNGEIAKKIPNSVYIPNLRNLGIAKALNQGCEKALQDGFEWILTMDQDSSFRAEELNNFLQLCETYYSENENIKSFAPEQNDTGKNIIPISKWIRFNILSPIKRKIFRLPPRKVILEQKAPTEYVNFVITSANIINLPAWEKVGKFDEELFIDEVDHDFCVRLKIKGYEIVKFNTCVVDHTLGHPKITMFSKVNHQSDYRLFYIFRNLMIENARYDGLPFVRNYEYDIKRYFHDYCIFDIKAIKHLLIYRKAKKAYKEFIKNDAIVQSRKRDEKC